MNKWKRYAQELESGQEERLAQSQILRERDEARAKVERLDHELGEAWAERLEAKAEVERLREALERIAQPNDGYSSDAGLRAIARAALHPDEEPS